MACNKSSYSDERICRYKQKINNFKSQSVITSKLGVQCKIMGFTLQIRNVMMSNFLNHCNLSVASHNPERPNQNCSGGIFFFQKVLGHEKWRHDDFNKHIFIEQKIKMQTGGCLFFPTFSFSNLFCYFFYISLRTKIMLILYLKFVFVCSLT